MKFIAFPLFITVTTDDTRHVGRICEKFREKREIDITRAVEGCCGETEDEAKSNLMDHIDKAFLSTVFFPNNRFGNNGLELQDVQVAMSVVQIKDGKVWSPCFSRTYKSYQ